MIPRTALLVLLLFFCTPGFSALSAHLRQQITDAALRSFLDPKLVEAVVAVESDFQPRATSNKGAMGLMQVMPKTAERCGITEPYHAENNLMGACECLRLLINRYQGNLKWALAAYNAGSGNVDRYHGVPPFRETRHYVEKIMKIYDGLRHRREKRLSAKR